ncbi:MAG: right-handed parallel beta-helix repeat-containing protein [Thermoplasmatota archaeon]
MNRNQGIFVGTSAIPAAIGILALLVIAFLMGPGNVEVSGANFYNVQSASGEKVVGLYKGPIWNGDIVANGDVINITAINQSTPSPVPTFDTLVIDLVVNDSAGANKYTKSWGLTYEGVGAEFTGNITLDKDLTQDTRAETDGIRIRVADGYKVSIKRSNSNNPPLLYFTADTSGPVISPVEPGASIAVHKGVTYAKKGGGMNLQLTDTSNDQAWFIANSKVTYKWDQGTPATWTGSSITIPSTKGVHTLNVSATDKFDQKTTWTKKYNVTDFLTETSISSDRTISGGIVFASTSTIEDDVTVKLSDLEIVFLNSDDKLTVKDGGELSITGSTIRSKGDHYTIISSPGSKFSINNSEMIGAGYADPTSSLLVMNTGDIFNVTFTNVPNRITISSAGVSFMNSSLTFSGMGSIDIDYNHRWGPIPTMLVNLSINGTTRTPIQVKNVSTYLPYDVTTRYYEDDTSGSAMIFLDTTNVTDPYLKLPHFVDARDPSATFDIKWNNSGTWESLPGFPASNMIYDEWWSGETGKIDLSGLPRGGHELNASWTADGDKEGCVHLGTPVVGGSNIQERRPGNPSLNIDYSKFGRTASGDVLLMKNITVKNASSRFLSISSSGGIDISGMHFGKAGTPMQATEFIRSVNSSFALSDTELVGGNKTTTAISVHVTAGNDWPLSTISNVSISKRGTSIYDAALDLLGGRVNVDTMIIENTTIGIRMDGGLINVDSTDIHPRQTGINVTLPDTFYTDMVMSVNDLLIGNRYSYSAFNLEGAGLNYGFDLTMEGYEFYSSSTMVYTRNDMVGGITLDLTSTRAATATLSGNVTKGPAHGIAIPNWPSNGKVLMEDIRVTDVDLDGIYLGNDMSVNITQGYLSQAMLMGIYAKDGANLGIDSTAQSPVIIQNMGSGGIWLGKDSEFRFRRVNISYCTGWAIEAGTGAVGTVTDTETFACVQGVRIDEGSNVTLNGLEVDSNSMGTGIWARSSDIIIGRGAQNTLVKNNNGNGIFIDGGSLHISRTWVQMNSGKGMILQGVDLKSMRNVKVEENGEEGLTIHIPSTSLLDSNGYYATIQECDIMMNSGVGLPITVDPAQVSVEVQILLLDPNIGGNSGGDIIATNQIHFIWKSLVSSANRNSLGSSQTSGVIRANIDVEVGTSAYAEMLNLNVTLRGSNNKFNVLERGTLRLEYCYVRPSQTTKGFSIQGSDSSTVQIVGGYFGQLSKLEMNNGASFYMEGTLVRYGEGPLALRSTEFQIFDSEISDIEGTGLMITGGGGRIEGTKFSSNTIGVMVEGLESDLTIVDCEIIDNKWGISLFNDSGKKVSIDESYFAGNSPAPIWTATSNANLLNTYIDPYKIQVTQNGYSVRLRYSLDVELLNEVGQDVEFDLTVDRGPGNDIDVYRDRTAGFSGAFESYIVRYGAVAADWVNVKITLEYEEGKNADGTSIMKRITDTFTLDEGTSITYYGYQAPRKTVKFPGKLDALEDRGLKTGTVDISTWFTDIGTDKGNLTYSTTTLSSEITPHLEGSILTISLLRDWNGMGNITVTATDPHGVWLTLLVNINVLGTNDQPYVTNPRIIALNSDSPTVPRTDDTIMGVWEWFDVDGDEEPQGHIIRWFLNGTHVVEHDNRIQIDGVFAGQIWNFTLYPADNVGISSGTYGTPAHSPPVMIGNLPPVLSSATITTKNAFTTTDLMASPGYWEDPETDVVTFNYLWERKTSTGYEALGAPNSPILDHRFTTRGDTIRVKVWVSDGMSISRVRTDEVFIRNSAPYVVSAKLMPEVVDEKTERIYVDDLVVIDPDGDMVTITYQWYVRGWPIAIADTLSVLQKSQGNWNYPSNISVSITPYDSSNLDGNPFELYIDVTPRDTDGDGLLDDADGNGRNDQNDDEDDDNDGYLDEWEEFMKTDPKDWLSKPLDTDGDGQPDGDTGNTKDWMDLDDDNDGVWDIHPSNADMTKPVWYDTFPRTASMPGDLDFDGIGNDQDPDIDGDGVPNEEDYAPYDPGISKAPETKETLWIQILTLLLVLVIFIAIGVFGYLVYNGTITLPTQAPPAVEGAEAIYDESPGLAKLPPKEEEDLEELESISTCSNCGELVSVEESECPNCGAVFEDVEEDEDEEEFDFDDYDDD